MVMAASVGCVLDRCHCCSVEVFSYLYILADGMSECTMTLDDSVSEEEEEEEGSFDELTDVTPYLQPGVELSVLNEVRPRRGVCVLNRLCNIHFVVNMPHHKPCENVFACIWHRSTQQSRHNFLC